MILKNKNNATMSTKDNIISKMRSHTVLQGPIIVAALIQRVKNVSKTPLCVSKNQQ
jgi:hypothetical protein